MSRSCRFVDQVVVITGAGSGIGRALAQAFASQGAKLALNDWQSKDLAATVDSLSAHGLQDEDRSAKVFSQAFDVSDLAAFTAFHADVLHHFGQVDIVINNAGVALAQPLADVSMEDFEWIMGINFWGMVYGTKLFLPDLHKRPNACVANVSSVFGLVSVPTQGTYNASKFAIRGFTEALWHELQGSNVTALSIHPGGIKTSIAANAKFHVGPLGETDHAAEAQNFAKQARTTPEQAAKQILRAIEKKQPRLLIGLDAKLMDRIQRSSPTRYWSVLKPMLQALL